MGGVVGSWRAETSVFVSVAADFRESMLSKTSGIDALRTAGSIRLLKRLESSFLRWSKKRCANSCLPAPKAAPTRLTLYPSVAHAAVSGSRCKLSADKLARHETPLPKTRTHIVGVNLRPL